MIKLTLTFFLLISGITSAQLNEEILLNTEYTSVMETICEETSVPDPCAGQEIYLTLKFEKRNVFITQKSVSTCGKEHISLELEYKWELKKGNEIKIFAEPNEIKYSTLRDLKFKVEDKIVYAFRNEGTNQFDKYIFLNK